MPRSAPSLHHRLVALALAAGAFAGPAGASGAPASTGSSDFSAVPIAVSIGIPIVLSMDAGALVVRGVEGSADGVTWVVENSVDGARASLRITGKALGASAVTVGTVIAVTAVSTGWVLERAGQVIAFVPNEIGKRLLYDEKVSK